jgi:hypothetical protein
MLTVTIVSCIDLILSYYWVVIFSLIFFLFILHIPINILCSFFFFCNFILRRKKERKKAFEYTRSTCEEANIYSRF